MQWSVSNQWLSYDLGAGGKPVGAVCLHELGTGRRVVGVDTAEIHFRPLPAAVVDTLVADESTM